MRILAALRLGAFPADITAGMNIDELLRHTVERGASDLHLKVGNVPFLRVDGDLQPTSHPVLTPQDTVAFGDAVMSEH